MDMIAQIEAEQIASLSKEIPDFKAGDTVVDADDNVVGVIESITGGPNSGEKKITFTAVTGEAVANNEELFTPHSLEFIFDIEY